MKKIFTFLFFAGLMTTAMAQNGGYGQHRDQNGGNYKNQSTVNAGNNHSYGQTGNGYGQPSQGINGYGQHSGNDYNQNNGYHQQEQGYSHNNENAYGNNRHDDDRRFHDNNRFDQRAYGYERRQEYERYNRGRFNARVVVRFGQPSCF